MNQSSPVIADSLVYALLYGARSGQRFTQDSPVLPEVWLELAHNPDAQVITLSVPYEELQAHELAHDLFQRLQNFRRKASREGKRERERSNVSDIPGVVGAALYLDEIIAVVLPMTEWWASDDLERLVLIWSKGSEFQRLKLEKDYCRFLNALVNHERLDRDTLPETNAQKFLRNDWRIEIDGEPKSRMRFFNSSTLRLITLLAVLDLSSNSASSSRIYSQPIADIAVFTVPDIWAATVRVFQLASFGLQSTAENEAVGGSRENPRIFMVSLNRHVSGSSIDSVRTTKGDAAKRLFNISCAGLAWAIIDSGVNPRHFAFRKCTTEDRQKLTADWDESGQNWCRPIVNERDSRVERRFDLSFVYQLRNRDVMLDTTERLKLARDIEKRCGKRAHDKTTTMLKAMASDLERGRAADWALVADLVRVAFEQEVEIDHGTHVAGILGGAWPVENDARQVEWFEGMCPDIKLFDFKVTGRDSKATEFAVIAAMRLIRHLNEANDYFVIHGANLSLSIPHDVTNYACGRTPVCDEAEKLHKSGVVVVAAAGNDGYNEFQTQRGVKSLHTTTSITDPGNAELIITVGSTHRREPHNYGVSYFSSRGPTGDGRMKPDLVAPGEKILGPVGEDEFSILEGTSMAAPHVSGAAAMLLSRYPELIGKPDQIKRILCNSATDVGRERAFQGHGVLDILRALQSV